MTDQTPPDLTQDHRPQADSLDAGLEAAFAPDSGPPIPGDASVVEALEGSMAAVPRVQLREPEGEKPTPMQSAGSAEIMGAPHWGLTPPARLEVNGEIARGGMGAILKGHDVELGRDIAVKVLLETHKGKTEFAKRFVEEAQINGQLQHPGIVPVYELGMFSDQRPYFTMKLVKGKTLAALLAEENSRTHSHIARFLAIYQQICQTLAYAHARGVIHRDLKPSNVMVGAYGEVQVMDWGLAKVLKEDDVADNSTANRERPRSELVSVIRTQRSADSSTPEVGSNTAAGTILGTPAYMAPEQARGEIDLVDERADVFGLGAILCEILTSKPPFTGKGPEAMRKAQTGQVADALARLDGCGAEEPLISLANRCLAAEPWNRPRNANEVTNAVSAYQNSVTDRLHQAELERAAAEARVIEEARTRQMAEAKAVEERKRRRVTVALAAVILLLVVGGGGTWYYLAEQQAKMIQAVKEDLQEATVLHEKAKGKTGDTQTWTEALKAAKRAEGRLGDVSGQEDLRDQVNALLAGLESELKDRRMVARLEKIRLPPTNAATNQFTNVQALADYRKAFRDFGIDVEKLAIKEAADRIKERPIRKELIAALDDWAFQLHYSKAKQDRQMYGTLLAIARIADPDPWRKRLRTAMEKQDFQTFKHLAKVVDLDKQPPQSLLHLGMHMLVADPRAALDFLKKAQAKHPDDFLLNSFLGYCLMNIVEPTAAEEALRYFAAALAKNPKSAGAHYNLGKALAWLKKWDEALAAYREADRLQTGYIEARYGIGFCLAYLGKFDQALKVHEETLRLNPNNANIHGSIAYIWIHKGNVAKVIAAYQRAIALEPDKFFNHFQLGLTYLEAKRDQEALSCFRKCVACLDGKPKGPDSKNWIFELRLPLQKPRMYAQAYTAIGTALSNLGQSDKALAAYEKAIQHDPRYFKALCRLGWIQRDFKRFDRAIAAFRQAVAINDPENYRARFGLAQALADANQPDEALWHCETCLALRSDFAPAYSLAGNLFLRQDNLPKALAALRRAIQIQPTFSQDHYLLGQVWLRARKPDEARDAFRRATQLQPPMAEAFAELGSCLMHEGKAGQAIESYQQAIKLNPRMPRIFVFLGMALAQENKLTQAVASYRKSLSIDPPNDHEVHNYLGAALLRLKKLGEAKAAFRKSIAIKPDFAPAHLNLGIALANENQLDPALASFRNAVALRPDWALAHSRLAGVLDALNRLDEAIAEMRQAIRLDPKFPMGHCDLGFLLTKKGQFAEALTSLQRGHELGSKQPRWPYPSAQWIKTVETLVALDAKLPAILQGKAQPVDNKERLALADMCGRFKRLYVAAVKFYIKAFEEDPKLTDIMGPDRYNAACCAASAGTGLGLDAPTDARERGRWRKQALDWLNAELKAMADRWETSPLAQRNLLRQRLLQWQKGIDLATVRDKERLSKLPKEEQEAWKKLWTDVEQMVKKTAGGK